MRRRDDDLAAWNDDPVVRALTGPASEEELAGEAAALAAFRTASRSSRRRFAGRFGAGGATFAVAAALSGGVAAAYGHALPAPIQQVAHSLLGPLGVPPSAGHGTSAGHHHHHTGTAGTLASATVSRPPVTPTGVGPSLAPDSAASTAAKAKHPQGATTPGTKQSHPSASPTTAISSPAVPSPSPTPPTPSPTPTVPPKPGQATMTVAATRVPAGQGETVTGHVVTSSGEPVPGHEVWLAERLTGTNSWQRVASAATGEDGQASLQLPSVTHSAFIRLTAGNGVRSAAVRVICLPELAVSTDPNGDQVDVTVTADGAQVGDSMLVQQRQQGSWQQVQSATVGESGAAQFAVPTPQGRRQVHYRVVLKATQAHGYAAAGFVVSPA